MKIGGLSLFVTFCVLGCATSLPGLEPREKTPHAIISSDAEPRSTSPDAIISSDAESRSTSPDAIISSDVEPIEASADYPPPILPNQSGKLAPNNLVAITAAT